MFDIAEDIRRLVQEIQSETVFDLRLPAGVKVIRPMKNEKEIRKIGDSEEELRKFQDCAEDFAEKSLLNEYPQSSFKYYKSEFQKPSIKGPFLELRPYSVNFMGNSVIARDLVTGYTHSSPYIRTSLDSISDEGYIGKTTGHPISTALMIAIDQNDANMFLDRIDKTDYPNIDIKTPRIESNGEEIFFPLWIFPRELKIIYSTADKLQIYLGNLGLTNSAEVKGAQIYDSFYGENIEIEFTAGRVI